MANRKDFPNSFSEEVKRRHIQGATKKEIKIFLLQEGAYPLEADRFSRAVRWSLKKDQIEAAKSMAEQGKKTIKQGKLSCQTYQKV